MSYLLTNITSQRLLFRQLQQGDFDTLLEFYKDPSSTEHWVSDVTDSLTNCKLMFQKTFDRYVNNKGGMYILTSKNSNEIVGLCGLLVQTVDDKEELEIGYSIMPAHRNRGFASEAAIKCKEFAFENELANSLISIIAVSNIASQTVAVKNNMQIDKTTLYSNNLVHIYRVWK